MGFLTSNAFSDIGKDRVGVENIILVKRGLLVMMDVLRNGGGLRSQVSLLFFRLPVVFYSVIS